MKFRKTTPEQAIGFANSIARMGACLAPSENAGKIELFLFKIWQWFGLILAFAFITPIMYDIYVKADVGTALRNIGEVCPMYTTVAKILLCHYHQDKLKACLFSMAEFMKSASQREREVLQFYADRCVPVHIFMVFTVICTAIGFSTLHCYLPQSYPLHVAYPFEVKTVSLRYFLIFVQVIGVAECGVLVISDSEFAALVWFTGARFEILSEEFENVSGPEDFCRCIKKHQELLEIAQDVNAVVRLVAGCIGVSTAIGTISGAIQILQDMPWLAKIPYIGFIIVGALEIFTYAWPAENLLQTSTLIGESAYKCRWIGESPKLGRLICMVMERAKKPSVISVGGFIPQLSLNFYGSFLSTSFSYFTTLRATTATTGLDNLQMD